jgi:Ca2+:H+ antiporter
MRSARPAPGPSGASARALGRAGAIALALFIAAGLAHYLPAGVLARFFLATVALAALAWLLALGCEAVGAHLGNASTAFLHASLGNLPELFVVIFALHDHELVLAQSALIGSLLANALLVLGLVLITGARRAQGGVMRFSARLANDTATLLLVCAFIIVLLALALSTHGPAAHHVEAVSLVGAGALLVVYAMWLAGALRAEGGAPRRASPAPTISLTSAVAVLVLGAIGAAFASDWFIAAATPAIRSLSLSRAFVGIVIVAIAGNAVENASGVLLAARGQGELAVALVKGAVAQIAAFLLPAAVIVSALLAVHLTFALPPLYAGAILLTALALRQVAGDGEASLFEGVALVALYVIIAVIAAL